MRRAGGAFGLGAAVVVAIAAVVRPSMRLEHVVAESGVLEMAHPWLWACCAAAAGFASFRTFARRDVWFFVWAAWLSAAAGLRELDLHVLLNPANIHQLGIGPEHAVHFRANWWLGGEASIVVRLMWALVLGAALAAFLFPFCLARVRWKRLLLAFDPFAWAFGMGGGMLALGYVMDDLILRAFTTPPAWGKLVEEGVEMVGVVLVLVSLLLAARRSPHQRLLPVLARERGGMDEPRRA